MFLFRLLFVVVFIYLISFVLRNFFVRPYRQGYQERDQSNRTKRARENEGRTSLNTNGQGRTHDNHQIGEYVDYEEVDDDDKA